MRLLNFFLALLITAPFFVVIDLMMRTMSAKLEYEVMVLEKQAEAIIPKVIRVLGMGRNLLY